MVCKFFWVEGWRVVGVGGEQGAEGRAALGQQRTAHTALGLASGGGLMVARRAACKL